MTAAIHRVTDKNSSLLDNIAADVFDHAIIPEQLQAFLDDPRHVLYVAAIDDVVVGMASGFEYFHPDKQPQLFINEVGVSPPYQRKGIGKQLVEALIDDARRRDCIFAWLGTDNDNLPAQACFGSVPGGSDPTQFLLYEWKLEK